MKDIYYERSKSFFNKVARKNYGNSKKLDELILNEIERSIDTKRKIRILDFGCGDGRFVDTLNKRFKKIECVGVDISKEMISLARERIKESEFYLIEDYDFSNLGRFDYIIAMNSFHHVSTPNHLISKFHSVLKASGEVLIGEVYVPPIMRGVINLYLPYSRSGDYRMYSRSEMKDLFSCNRMVERKYSVEYFNFIFLQCFKKEMNI